MRSDRQLSRLSRLIFVAALFAGCAPELRARYSFIPQDSYRVDPDNVDTSSTAKHDDLLIRCTEDELPVKCAFEDQDVVVDLELVNRAPRVSIANETDEPIVVLCSQARFELPDGQEVPVELVTSTPLPPSATEIDAHEVIDVRLHPLDLWESRCNDVSDYDGPTRPGMGYTLGPATPSETRQGAGITSGCRFFPKPMVIDSAPGTNKKKLSPAAQRALLSLQIGKKIRLVLPVEVAGKAFKYVVAYAVADADIQ